MNFLQTLVGKRTYLIAVAIAVLNLLVAFNVISVDQLETINMVLGALGLATLRASVPPKA
jgi:hypothetical protein